MCSNCIEIGGRTVPEAPDEPSSNRTSCPTASRPAPENVPDQLTRSSTRTKPNGTDATGPEEEHRSEHRRAVPPIRCDVESGERSNPCGGFGPDQRPLSPVESDEAERRGTLRMVLL